MAVKRQPTPGGTHPHPGAMMTSDELDWLVYSYLEESGYHHTSFSLLHESALAGPSTSSAASSSAPSPQPNGRDTSAVPGRNPVMDHVVPPGHLIRLLQKGLLYLEAEARYRGDPDDPPPRIVGYPIPSSLQPLPLPKYVPPAAPSPAPTPPVSSGSTDAKGKGKAKEPAPTPAASSAAAPKRKAEKANAGEESAEPGKRARTTSAEMPVAVTSGATKKGKGKEREKEPAPAPSATAVDKERSIGKGKEKEKDVEGDVSMDEALAPAGTSSAPQREPSAPAPAKVKDGAAKTKERARDPQSAAGPSAKREREKDDLRPPPAKKSATAAATPAASASGSATANSSAAAAPKRSASPTVARKPKPSSSGDAASGSSAAPATPAPPPPSKFRITTTTKTVTTPVPVSAGASAALAAQQRRRGSGDSDAPSRAKVKPEAEGVTGGLGKNGAAGPKSPVKGTSPLKAAGGGAGGKELDMKGVRTLKCEDKEVIKLKGHTQMKVQPCAFNSKVPSLLATGGADGTCRIWDVPTTAPNPPVLTERMKCKHPSSSRRVDITAVAWDPSGSLLATATEDGIARIWTVSGDLHLVLSMHQRSISALKWSPGGTMLLTASLDQTVCLWEVSNGKVRQQYSTHSDQVLDVDWNDDGLFASTSSDKMVHLLSTSRPTPLHRFRGHRDDVNVVKFSPCGTLVASCADDTTVRVWSLRNIGPIAREIAAKPVRKGDGARRIDAEPEDSPGGGGGVWVLEGHESDVHQVAWHPTAGKEGTTGPRLLASCSFDSTAKLWDADAGTCLYTFARSTDFVYSISFEPTLGRYLATGSNDGRLDVWRVKDYALVSEYTHSGEIYELTWHPHGQQLAVCGGTEEVAVIPLLLGTGAAGA